MLSSFPYTTRHQEKSQDHITMATSNPLLARLRKLIKRIPIARNKKATVPREPAAAAPTIPTKVAAPEQPQEVVRQQPIIHQDSSSVAVASTMPTLQIALQNQTASNEIYAYISKHDPSIERETPLTPISRPSHRQQEQTVLPFCGCQNAVLPVFSILDRSELGRRYLDPSRRTRKHRHCDYPAHCRWPHLVLLWQASAVPPEPRPRPRGAFDLQPGRPEFRHQLCFLRVHLQQLGAVRQYQLCRLRLSASDRLDCEGPNRKI